ncbi:MAG: DUF4412 domain-containing protein [Deltaproteobacteria bacterium]
MKVIKMAVFALFAVFLLQGLSHAGMVFKEISYLERSGKTSGRVSTNYISNNRMKVVSQDGPYIIMDFNNGTMFMVNAGDKTYWGGDFNAMLKQTKDAFKQMMSALNMAGQAGQVNQAKKTRLAVKKTGQTTTIAGYVATRYEIYADKDLFEEIWAGRDLAGEIGKEFDFKKAEIYGRQLQEAFAFGPVEFDYADLSRVDGYVLRRKTAGGAVIETISVEKKAVTENEFQVPAGYKKAEPEDMFGQGMPVDGAGR